MKRIYLDYAAAAPLDPRVKKVMEEVEGRWANPSSLHEEGRGAREVVDSAREKIANVLGVDTDKIIFTSGATESNVLALRGVIDYVLSKGVKSHLIVSAVEHPSVKETAEQLEESGCIVTWVGVDERGLVRPEELAEAIKENTTMVSIIYGNHELGVVQNIAELVKIAKSKNPKVLFHTDAAQTLGWVPFKISDLGVDLLTGSSYKLYGPKGVGFLFVRAGTKLQPLFPGFQEWGRRAGTESTSLIAGMARALELCQSWPRDEVRKMRDDLITGVIDYVRGVKVNTYVEQSLPHIAHFSFGGVASDVLNIALDRGGLATSPGSACSTGAVDISHVVKAIGVDTEKYPGQLRLSLGINTSEKEIKKAVGIIGRVAEKLRMNSALV